MGFRISLVMILSLIMVYSMQAQDDGYTHLSLQDLSQFQSQAGNWQIVGDVYMDRNVDVHPPQPEETTDKRKKKRKKKESEPPKAVYHSPGEGILLNINNETLRDALLTNWEHGDIDLSLEVMLPKGSNSGIYLQGRYEVQLFDSWGVRNPKFSDIGGIYRNWESEPDKIYMGKAPLSNPSKAPGLWQKLDIAFRAPKFDASGNKISNALLAYVDLNGVRIHENVEIPKPTGGPVDNKEASTGPLMIQGDHGPVAFKNIKYRSLKESEVKLGAVNYQVFHKPIVTIEELKEMEPDAQGVNPVLSAAVLTVPDQFAVRYQGDITIPEDGTYDFTLAYTGGAVMSINGTTLIDEQRPDGWWRTNHGEMTLEKGDYPISITYYKNAEWMPPRLALMVKTAATYTAHLHEIASYPPDLNPISTIPVDARAEVRMLRAFLDFKGDKTKRLTHTIGVGEPSGLNYVYDMGSGSIAAVWRGEFIDATPMWHSRGDGSFKPRGAALFLNHTPRLHTNGEATYKSLGYKIDANSGRPLFRYQLGSITVTDQIYPGPSGNELSHEINFEGAGASGNYVLAESESIRQLPDGSYAIGDMDYYIKINSGAITLESADHHQQLVSEAQGTLSYTIIW